MINLSPPRKRELIHMLSANMTDGTPSIEYIASYFSTTPEQISAWKSEILKESDKTADAYKRARNAAKATDHKKNNKVKSAKDVLDRITESDAGAKSEKKKGFRIVLFTLLCAAAVVAVLIAMNISTFRKSSKPSAAAAATTSSEPTSDEADILFFKDAVEIAQGTQFDPKSNVAAVRDSVGSKTSYTVDSNVDANVPGDYTVTVKSGASSKSYKVTVTPVSTPTPTAAPTPEPTPTPTPEPQPQEPVYVAPQAPVQQPTYTEPQQPVQQPAQDNSPVQEVPGEESGLDIG